MTCSLHLYYTHTFKQRWHAACPYIIRILFNKDDMQLAPILYANFLTKMTWNLHLYLTQRTNTTWLNRA